MKQIIHLS